MPIGLERPLDTQVDQHDENRNADNRGDDCDRNVRRVGGFTARASFVEYVNFSATRAAMLDVVRLPYKPPLNLTHLDAEQLTHWISPLPQDRLANLPLPERRTEPNSKVYLILAGGLNPEVNRRRGAL